MYDELLRKVSELERRLNSLTAPDVPKNQAPGWFPFPYQWWYASASSVIIYGRDVRSFYTVGTRVKWMQPTAKYGYVIGSSYSGGNTTLTITGGSDYAVTNVSIDRSYYSYSFPLESFPQWFNWAPTITGYSVNPTNANYRFMINGRSCTLVIREATAGTSNATTTTYTLPVTATTIASMLWSGMGSGTDNSATLTTPVMGIILSAGTTLQMFKDTASNAWTNANGKRIGAITIIYEI